MLYLFRFCDIIAPIFTIFYNMEETPKTILESKPEQNYIDISEDSNNVGNIFNELSGEL